MHEFVQQAQYQEPAQNDENLIPTCTFDQAVADDTIVVDTSALSPMMLPPYSTSRRASKAKEEDTSELVPHHQIALESSNFKLALGLFANNTGMSRQEYLALKEILSLLGNTEIDSLPSSVTTLKKQVTRQLPLLKMRKKSIPLIPAKLASETAARKATGF